MTQLEVNWICDRDIFGNYVEYRDGSGGQIMFRPNQHGRVVSFSIQGGVVIELFSIMRAMEGDVRARVAPDRGRYGHRFSPHRRALCEAIANLLNERAITPKRPLASKATTP